VQLSEEEQEEFNRRIEIILTEYEECIYIIMEAFDKEGAVERTAMDMWKKQMHDVIIAFLGMIKSSGCEEEEDIAYVWDIYFKVIKIIHESAGKAATRFAEVWGIPIPNNIKRRYGKKDEDSKFSTYT